VFLYRLAASQSSWLQQEGVVAEMAGASAPPSVTFHTTLTATGKDTGIVVPLALIEELGTGKRPSVIVDVNGYQYRNTVGVMGGKHLISVSAAIRAQPD
jgi:hypothetical protein